jgi:hypothetical protein
MPKVGNRKFPDTTQGELKASLFAETQPEGKNKVVKEDNSELAKENFELFLQYSSERFDWASQVVENDAFRNNAQWTSTQQKTLEERGHSPLVLNRIHPAVEMAKSMMTANRPRFTCSPREDSDTKMARLWGDILAYIWDTSRGNTVIKRVIDDYYVKGMGVLLCYIDPYADMGKGEVLFSDIDPLDIYIDPASRDPFIADASNIIYSRLFTYGQLEALYPDYIEQIANAQPDNGQDYPGLDRYTAEQQKLLYNTTINDISFGGKDTNEQKTFRLVHRYRKEPQTFWHIYQKWDNYEAVYNDNEWDDYLKEDVYTITIVSTGNIKICSTEEEIAQAKDMLNRYGEIFHYARNIETDPQTGIPSESNPVVVPGEEPPKETLDEPAKESESPDGLARESARKTADPQNLQHGQTREAIEGTTTKISVLKKAHMIEQGNTLVQEIEEDRVRVTCSIGKDTVLYDYIMPCRNYPIVTFMNRHNRTPYPLGDITFVKGLQEYINKINSLIIAHATSTTSPKLLINKGTVNKKEIMEEWARPGAGVIEVDFADGEPKFTSPAPLPNELYRNIEEARGEIEYILGIYELMQGGGQTEPTARGLLAKDEFGGRRIRSKMHDIEAGLSMAGTVLMDLSQDLWRSEKIIRVVNPNQPMTELAINQKLYDEYSGDLIDTANNLAVGRYDVIVQAGSMLPTNRYAALEYYKEFFQMGIIDQQEVLKKSEIFDTEGILERTGAVQQLQSQVAQLQQQVKDLTGDLQTAHRESMHDKKRVELEKSKSRIKETELELKKSQQIYSERLNDALKQQKKVVDDQQTIGGGPFGLPAQG